MMNGRQAAAILIVVGLGIGFGLWARASWVGVEEPDRAASAPPATSAVPASSGAAEVAVVRPAPTAVPTPANRDVVLEVSEAQMNAELTDRLVGQPLGVTPLGEAKIQSVGVQLRDRVVKLDGNAAVGFVSSPFTIAGTVQPDHGRPIVDVRQAVVGGFALPVAARAALAESLQVQVDRMLKERAVKVRSIDIADGTMRLIGTPDV